MVAGLAGGEPKGDDRGASVCRAKHIGRRHNRTIGRGEGHRKGKIGRQSRGGLRPQTRLGGAQTGQKNYKQVFHGQMLKNGQVGEGAVTRRRL